jgi:hypothetical protein
LTPAQSEYASVLDDGAWKTILTSRYRESVENDDDPRIQIDIWLSEQVIQRINELTKKKNAIHSIFVLFPTKESVFVSRVQDISKHAYLAKLKAEESSHRQRLIRFMNRMNID